MGNPQGVWAKAIRRGLTRTGLSQADVATLIGETPQRISDWKRGYREPSDTAKAKLVKVLGIPAHEVTPEWLRHAREDGEAA